MNYFIVLTIHNRKNNFSDEKIADIILSELVYKSKSGNEINLYCYCLMPKKLYMILSLKENCRKPLKNWVAAFKRKTSKRLNLLYKIKIIWDKGFYREILDNKISFNDRMNYIFETPVREGFVKESRDHKYMRFIRNAEY